MFSSSLILVFKIIALTYYFGSTLSNKEKNEPILVRQTCNQLASTVECLSAKYESFS